MAPLQVISLVLFSVTVSAVYISIPLAAPSTTHSPPPNYISLSLEQDRWTDWAGTTSPNHFFLNALHNLVHLTGASPHIRIGANSEDHTNFNPNVEYSEAIFPAFSAVTPYPEATNITVGDGYYKVVSNLPKDTHVTWGVNFGQNNITAAFLEARSIAKAFNSHAVKNKGITLDFIEIGNEADLYKNNGLRSSTYNVSQYVKEWTTFATNVSAAAGISENSHTKLLGASFAASSSSTTGFSPQGIFADGILSSQPGKLISTISQHHYSGTFCAGTGSLLQDLMTKSRIRGNLTAFSPDVAATHAQGLDYILGETNSDSCHGAPGVSNTAGAALWALDYALFAVQVGISRVFFHDGIGFKYNLIQPVTLTRSTLDGSNLSSPLPPHVQPQYYAAIIAAEAFGKHSPAKAIELSINDPQISGYAFYEHGSLARAVFINLNAFLTGSANRTSVHLDFDFTGSLRAPRRGSIKRLAIGHADDTAGLTWGGQTYETSDALKSGHLSTTKFVVSNGLDIQETEAVLVSFH